MIQIEDFRVIITVAYDGYGRNIRDKQIAVMHSQMKKFDKHTIQAAIRRHLRESPRMPMISDLLKHCGGVPNKAATKCVCGQCAGLFENVITVGYKNPYQVCSGCFYKLADKAGISALSLYADNDNDKVKNAAQRLMR